MVQIKRVYEPAAERDGFRILVDRLWPRGLAKKQAHIDLWVKTIAPTSALRTWFGHDPAKWKEFQQRYARELKEHADTLLLLKHLIKEKKHVTFLYAARDEEHNNAVALKKILKV